MACENVLDLMELLVDGVGLLFFIYDSCKKLIKPDDPVPKVIAGHNSESKGKKTKQTKTFVGQYLCSYSTVWKDKAYWNVSGTCLNCQEHN